MKRKVIVIIACLLIGSSLYARSRTAKAIDTFLHSSKIEKQYKAICILEERREELSQYLLAYFNQPHESITEYECHLYLAFIARDKRLVPVLIKHFLDQENSDDECIYCCPIILVLQSYYFEGLYNPSDYSLTQWQVEELTASYNNYGHKISRIEQDNYAESEYKATIMRVQSMSTKMIERLAASNDESPTLRVTAANELAYRAPNGLSTARLLGLALIPSSDASGEYLCYLYDGILRNLYCKLHEKR